VAYPIRSLRAIDTRAITTMATLTIREAPDHGRLEAD
jgi:hypothetical protein